MNTRRGHIERETPGLARRRLAARVLRWVLPPLLAIGATLGNGWLCATFLRDSWTEGVASRSDSWSDDSTGTHGAITISRDDGRFLVNYRVEALAPETIRPKPESEEIFYNRPRKSVEPWWLTGVALAPWPHDRPWPRPGERDLFQTSMCGWPLPVVWWSWGCIDPYSPKSPPVLIGRLPLWPSLATHLRWPQVCAQPGLPIRPVWIPFTLHAATVWALLAAILWLPGRLKRKRRRSRGQCVYCAYDLRGLPTASPCPECGRWDDGMERKLSEVGHSRSMGGAARE